MATHTFDSTGDAGKACQCDGNVKKGDILLVPSEDVVGIADVWPIAITKNHGEFHSLSDTTDAGLVTFLADNFLDN